MAPKTDVIEQLRTRIAELEERRCEICGYAEHNREHTGCLRTQLAAAQEEIAAINRDKKALTNRVFDLGCQLETVKSQVSDACAACVADQDDVPLGVVGVLRQGLWREYMPETTLDEAEDQLAKAEQRVAEAIAEFLESLAWRVKPVSANEAAIEIRSGEWRKFVKEV